MPYISFVYKAGVVVSKVRIGTRSSALAMIQANMVKNAVEKYNKDIEVELVKINTSGDWRPEHGETRLCEAEGGKGLFAKEIELAILDGFVDCGVHSVKDMSSFLPDGLVMDYALPRENPLDALIARDKNISSINDLPQGGVVGTSSLRRQSILLSLRPDLKVVPLRGNVATRLEKLERGDVDATFLAMAGLERLGITDKVSAVLDPFVMVPACGQGIVGIEIKEDDNKIRDILEPINDFDSLLSMVAERAVLKVLDGSCRTPIGAYSVLSGECMKLTAFVGSEDGTLSFTEEGDGQVTCVDEAEAFGKKIGRKLKEKVPSYILDKVENGELEASLCKVIS